MESELRSNYNEKRKMNKELNSDSSTIAKVKSLQKTWPMVSKKRSRKPQKLSVQTLHHYLCSRQNERSRISADKKLSRRKSK